MMLMVTIGYVFSYLIPTKQKSVRFSIYSTQAFYIAQSGVEFAVRYASDRGWRGATDGTYDLNRLNGISQSLGNGTFTLSYNNILGDILTSTGQITGSTENRVVRVSNFSPFLRLIFDPASPAPCWSSGTQQVRFYIQNIRSENVTLTAFSATWTQSTPTRQLRTIDMDGVQKFSGNYSNGNPAVNFNQGGNQQTILANEVITVVVEWNNNITNGRNIIITFYNAAGKSYPFNLDASGDGLPAC